MTECKHSPSQTISLANIRHPHYSLKCFTCGEVYQDEMRWKGAEWSYNCEHYFPCHSSDPHCTKCGINRSEIE